MASSIKNLYETLYKQILSESTAQQYIALAKKHDWTYMHSDAYDIWRQGRDNEIKLMQIYRALPEDEKTTAALYFKQVYQEKGPQATESMKSVEEWDIEKDGIEDFNGVGYYPR